MKAQAVRLEQRAPASAAPALELRGVHASFGTTEILADVNLQVAAGEFVAIVGFSGSGKSTLISLLAGLLPPTAGSVLVNGAAVTGPGPDRGVVFQGYALMPWLTVRDNIALAVDAAHAGRSRTERRALVDHYVDIVGLAHAADRRPAELSGGMRQRVAVARALAMAPDVLLLDEPLSALDALTRANLQDEIEAVRARDRKTVVLVTNDVDEAILLADRIVALSPGPPATLGPEFRVGMPRPRDRASINDDPEFRRLRGVVTRCLLDASRKRAATDTVVALPTVAPPRHDPPRAYVKAGGYTSERYVEFFNVSKTFATPRGPLTVVDGFDLRLDRGECVALIGHSGCGKSTVLSMAAGLMPLSGGGIVVDHREVAAAGPDRAVVFQAPSLFPWLTAAQNVALGVDRVYPHAARAERRDIVDYYLARVGLHEHRGRRAADLSSGMRQRVGIARAFALSPKLLLLDEPFGMLDSLTRWELQELLMEVWTRTRVTAICVTHDVDEAILLADRVVMMTNGPHARIGRIMRVDLPRPRTRKALLEHPDYYAYRQEILAFLGDCAHGAHAPATD
ncbi:MAG TPA: ABC transporter ATP-binding protein [Gammaproteobacteria bacterium]|jgi:nitrate/nitrite transport system ATP-binding protein|nr:ABC transporter ATP-binding protein [Gammaproteobacteria bacterium]